ncbi:MAG: hypothetical protein H7Y32_03250 [Chloroflexales bacterium]|nr:hypothetical protein [Chloroflexales bacterium]
MNTSQRTVYAGVALIVLGALFLTGMGGLLPALALAGGGVYLYQTQRRAGSVDKALVGGLWGVGLALIWLTGAWLAGLLLLGGLTVLMRGREQRVDATVQRYMAQGQAIVQSRRAQRPTTPAVQSPPVITRQPSPVTIIQDDVPTTGDTTRLR